MVDAGKVAYPTAFYVFEEAYAKAVSNGWKPGQCRIVSVQSGKRVRWYLQGMTIKMNGDFDWQDLMSSSDRNDCVQSMELRLKGVVNF